MSTKFQLSTKVYEVSPGKRLSMEDLLDYFTQAGRMRVSDLHIK
mgnify:CR=1 FL=1